MRTLFEIAISTVRAVRHDLANVLTGIETCASLIIERPARFSDDSKWTAWMRNILTSATHGRRIIDLGLGFKHAALGDDPFIAQPALVLDEILMLYPETTIRIDGVSHRSLHLVYPTSSLFMTIHELVVNAIKHSTTPVQLLASWKMREERFVFEVEDDGPGISDDLSTSYLPLDALKFRGERGYGLRAVRTIIDYSEGLLLFRRSSKLGGTHVLFEFPVVGLWIDDHFRQYEFVYGH